MRSFAILKPALLQLTLVACSGTDDGLAPSANCAVAGTYVMTVQQQESGSCEIDPDAGTGPVPEALTVTITRSGLSRPAYRIEMQGATGACPGELIEACKLQTKCAFHATDAIDPANADGTIQFSWTFNDSGFTGTNSISLPPARGLPRGCVGIARATATRR